jgi:hypothetical protein
MENQDPMESKGSGRADDPFSVDLDWGGDAGDAAPSARREPADPARAARHLVPADQEDDPQLTRIQETLDALRDEVAQLRSVLTESASMTNGASSPPPDQIAEELAALRGDIVALKRRLAVRAAGSADHAALDPEHVARLVAEQLAELSSPPTDPR